MRSTPSTDTDSTIMDLETGISLRTGDGLGTLESTDRAAREEIQHRAYARWEQEGHPSDRMLANWLEAERDVLRRG